MAADTSIEAYHGHRSKSDIQREQIAALLANGPMSMHAIEKRLNIPRASVCGRMGELRDQGRVRKAYKDKDEQFGTTVWLWEAVD